MKMDCVLPYYTVQEEKFNMVSHLCGVLLGMVMIFMSVFCSHSAEGQMSGLVFGISLILLYLASSIYHGLPPHFTQLKSFFRVIDHCSIFLLCAGSCTPFTCCAFSGAPAWQGWAFHIYIWAIAFIGMALLIRNMHKYKKLSIVLYLLIGVSMVMQGSRLSAGLGAHGLTILLAGVAIYGIGLLLYSVKRPWFHSAFHLLCIAASILHVFCVTVYII